MLPTTTLATPKATRQTRPVPAPRPTENPELDALFTAIVAILNRVAAQPRAEAKAQAIAN